MGPFSRDYGNHQPPTNHYHPLTTDHPLTTNHPATREKSWKCRPKNAYLYSQRRSDITSQLHVSCDISGHDSIRSIMQFLAKQHNSGMKTMHHILLFLADKTKHTETRSRWAGEVGEEHVTSHMHCIDCKNSNMADVFKYSIFCIWSLWQNKIPLIQQITESHRSLVCSWLS